MLGLKWIHVSDYTCSTELRVHLRIAGSEWSDESCAPFHGPVTGIRIWTSADDGYVTLWVSIANTTS